MVPAGAAPYLDLLRRYHANLTPHSGRSLIDHLLGVYGLLESWGNAPEICRAGLFHSIYGTNIFNVKSADFDQRSAIQEGIGERAERLAYIFCVSDRPVAFLKAAAEKDYRLSDIVHGTELPIDPSELNALIEIEVANFLEHPENLDDVRLIYDTIVAITRSGPLVSARALQALATTAMQSGTL